MINLDLSPIIQRAQLLSKQERYDDADALFAEYSEWFIDGSDADQTVITLPIISQQ